jgi:hypothetical protein
MDELSAIEMKEWLEDIYGVLEKVGWLLPNEIKPEVRDLGNGEFATAVVNQRTRSDSVIFLKWEIPAID